MKLLFFLLCSCLISCGEDHKNTKTTLTKTAEPETSAPVEKVIKSEKEWRELLSPEVYRIARESGTERAFGPNYKAFKEKEKATGKTGVWECACCDHKLFKAETSFDSGSGWPSFYSVYSKNSVIEKTDNKYGWSRTEVICAKCDAHLGHVFKGERFNNPTDLRYCINAAVLKHSSESSSKESK